MPMVPSIRALVGHYRIPDTFGLGNGLVSGNNSFGIASGDGLVSIGTHRLIGLNHPGKPYIRGVKP